MTDTSMETPVSLTVVPGKTDRELADEFRVKVRVLLDMTCQVMNEANAAGLEIGWSIVRNPLGKNIVQEVQVKRPL